MADPQEVVQYAIHPAIGIARVGNSPDEFFTAPQYPGDVPAGPYKDAQGAVKRQAAQFRIYGLNQAGEVVKEITEDSARIEWRVHLANRKAGWYQFNNAMDLGPFSMTSAFRNNSMTGKDRESLVIDPGPRTISGRNAASVVFDTGKFQGASVYLGELRTDGNGRLLVLGGRGHSQSASGSPATTFANNDDWHDDTSDGPVRATVVVDGVAHEAVPAMVAVTPPNFGQGLFSVITMYDVVYDLFVREGWIGQPDQVVFERDVLPIFERLVQCQWVNQGIYFLFGQNSPADLLAPDLLKQLSTPDSQHRAERERLFRWFLDPDGTGPEPVKLPPFYGDLFGDYENQHGVGLSLTRTQYAALRKWAEGEFVNDKVSRSKSLAELPVSEQPHALDRAALEECLGGPFHPGIELTWPMRHLSMWHAPFRLNVLPENEPVRDDFGPLLTPESCLGKEGPLTASGPGTLTRWMGVPWQTDEASCLAGYTSSTYLPIPSFWAVRVPNDVLSAEAYDRVLDGKLPLAQRLKHFDHRQFWLRDFSTQYQARINSMVKSWEQIGIVAQQPGPPDSGSAGLPSSMWVETGRLYSEFDQRKSDPTWQQLLIAEGRVDAAREEQPVTAATAFHRHLADIPPKQRRRRYRRDQL